MHNLKAVVAPKLALAVAGVSLFVSGIALGQKQTEQRFLSSRIPASLTTMDSNLIQANLNLLREAYGYDKDGIGVPWVYFDYSTGKVKAFASVDGDKLGRQPTDLTKAILLLHVATTRGAASTFIPELKAFPKVDLEMEFEGLAVKRMFGDVMATNQSSDLKQYTFYAEYRNGELLIRQRAP